MPQSRNINTYGDINAQLIEIRKIGGARVDFETFAQATVWTVRAYTFRRLMRDQRAEANPVPGHMASTPWDDMVIRHDKLNRATFVTVEFAVVSKGKITPLHEQVGDTPAAVMEDPSSDLIASITALAQKEGAKE